ncbi:MULTISPECIES: SCO family protein [unclassified Olleya]|uniref:SCO family protein n=1 Tax=unclassified Olleya TaxID=2615019 RepID=UPI0011A7904B|nr:SCO family protein [Olleya sp. Hel_I_94]TVZ47022.1 protein SCO1/2 [Olleya sp. Hel_I_94]|tara:strand:- start:132178 stop:132846 length:669 start_codon:yes stop_codon:yes gene_type:complete
MKYLCIIVVLIFTSCKKDVKKENIKVIENSRVEYLPYYNDDSFTPHWLTPNTKEERAFHKIPDFSLQNQLGETVTQSTFDNKIYITDFFFTTCPGICPKMTGNMAKIQEEFKNDQDVLLLSHSVMPSTDSVSVLNAYATNNNVIANKWHLVTGDRQQIYDLGRDHYFVESDLGEIKSIDDFLHTENFLLIDKNKHIRGIYNGLNRASIAQLIIDIKALKIEG